MPFMSGYCVRILRPAGYIHARVFEVAARAFEGALTDLGIFDDRGTPIVFGAHLMQAQLPPDAILYQSEVLGSPWLSAQYLYRLQQHQVLDYDEKNVRWLRHFGVNAKHCPIRYHPSLTRLTMKPEAERDIDVLFYGGVTERRAEILSAVKKARIDVWIVDHMGWELTDHYIPRAKIVLNLHAYETSPFEIFRVSYLLANGAFVISEGAPEPPFMCSLMWRTTDEIVEGCRAALADEKLRRDIAQTGQKAFMQTSQAEVLKGVLT
jgi:hypothetical protein